MLCALVDEHPAHRSPVVEPGGLALRFDRGTRIGRTERAQHAARATRRIERARGLVLACEHGTGEGAAAAVAHDRDDDAIVVLRRGIARVEAIGIEEPAVLA